MVVDGEEAVGVYLTHETRDRVMQGQSLHSCGRFGGLTVGCER